MAKFLFRSSQTIGAAAAEQDSYYLNQCYVPTAALDILRDVNDHRRLLIARTGAGKSALLARLAEIEPHVVKVLPESLSITYISNSNIIKFFSDMGVNLDIFYKLLWRHVLVVEILKEKYQINNEERKLAWLEELWRLVVKNKKNEKALAYLREWGEDFWKETEYRVKDITTKLERDLEAAVEAKIPEIASFNLATAKKLSEEKRTEIIQRAQEVVNRVQIRELSDVIDFLGELLNEDSGQEYYVTIDKLDEDWVEEKIRFRLIRALIETSLDFARIKNLKVIIAIRTDLLDRVYRLARSSDFQEEKHRSVSLDIGWTRQRLIEVLDTRIDLLVRSKYTRQRVKHTDLLPTRKIGRQEAVEYMLDRTLLRPRDIIEFFNTCIRFSDGKASIPLTAIQEAEGVYSRERLRALADEWQGVYPLLLQFTPVLRGRRSFFSIGEVPAPALAEIALALAVGNIETNGVDTRFVNEVTEGNLSPEDFRAEVVLMFYKVGIVGLKLNRLSTVSWSQSGGVSISRPEVDISTKIHVHKMFWRVLGVTDVDHHATVPDENASV
jgi:hypothetical protein